MLISFPARKSTEYWLKVVSFTILEEFQSAVQSVSRERLISSGGALGSVVSPGPGGALGSVVSPGPGGVLGSVVSPGSGGVLGSVVLPGSDDVSGSVVLPGSDGVSLVVILTELITAWSAAIYKPPLINFSAISGVISKE